MVMTRILLAALLCSVALPGHAMPPAVSFVAGVFGAAATGASVGAYLAGVGFASSFVGSALLRLGASVLLSAASRALGPKPPAAPELIRELQQATSLVPKRFIYGQARIYGSPIWRVKGGILYGALILNSRPSDAVTGLWFDKRPCAWTGNPYDLAGPGAAGTTGAFAGHVTFWVGLGGQVAAPAAIVAEAPALFSASDAGRGLTVMWLRLNVGDNGSRAVRWPRTPPEVEVDGRWSKVWDMRDGAQNPADPATWAWSANQALCALDAARMNPIRPYPLSQLLLDSFEDAADLADEAVPLKAGGTEPRYRVNGALIFNGSEIMDQLLPLFAAGAADPVRVGGRLGIVPGAYTAPVGTVADITEAEGLDFQALKPGRDLATTLRCTFTDPARDWRTSSLDDYTVPGAQAADGGLISTADLELPQVTSASQAMRVQKFRAYQQRAQRQLTCTLPPSAFKLVSGCNVTVAFPAPYAALNGVYRVESANPSLFAGETDGGVAMRVPVVLKENSPAGSAWTPATDERDRVVVSLDVARVPPAAPGAVTTTSGAAVAVGSGAGAQPAIRFAFDPSATVGLAGYEWEYLEPLATWATGGFIGPDIRDGAGKVFGVLFPARLSSSYTIRVRAVGRANSAWVESAPVLATLDLPRWVADFEDGVYQIDGVAGTLGNLVTVARASVASFVGAGRIVQTAAANVARIDHLTGVPCLLIEGAGANAWTFSEDLTDAAWTKTRATIAANAGAAPDGTTTADRLTEDGSTGTHFLRRTRAYSSGVRADFLLHAKASGRSKIRVSCQGSGMTTQRADIDLTTGAVTIVAGAPTVTATLLQSGWYRIEAAVTPNATVAGTFDVLLINGTAESYAGDGTSGALIWGLQDGAGSYIATTSAAGSRAADVPAMQGLTAVLDLIATYADSTTFAVDAAPVIPGFWPSLAQPRLRSLIGTI